MSALSEQMSKIKVDNTSLFKDVKFCLIDCDNQDNHNVKQLLVDGGARQISYMSDMVTHVISDTDESADVSEAREIFEKPVITCLWVIMSIKCNVLLPVEGFAPESKQLFSDIVACPSKLSKKDCCSLWALVTFYGGKLKLRYDKSCSHLISSLPSGNKYEKALLHGAKIVTPDWAIDSVKNKEKCDEELYHPRLLILPKSPTPSPPPIIEPPPQVVVESPPSTVPQTPQFGNIQPTAVSGVQQGLQNFSGRDAGIQQKLLWQQQRLPRPQAPVQQRTVATTALTQDGVPTTVGWQQRPPHTVLTSTQNTTNPRAAIWQQQLASQGRLTPQQQMILQQKWLHHQQQQQSVNRQATVSHRQPNSNHQVPMLQQQRLQIQVSQVRPGSGQQQKPTQMPLNQRRFSTPNQISQPQIQQTSSQITSQNQVPTSQQIQLMQNQLHRPQASNMQLQQAIAQQRMHLSQQLRPVIQNQTNNTDQNALNQQKTIQAPAQRLPVQQTQLSGPLTQQQHQQLLWQQQQQQQQQLHQRPPGRVIIQHGPRQVQYDVQSQVRMQQQVMWQQRRQMVLTNQQRQPGARVQVTMNPQQRLVSQQSIPSHPPPPYPGKANQPPEAMISPVPREATPQQQVPVTGHPIINSAGQIVTPKTKTALANLLNTRLQTGTISPNQKEVIENSLIQTNKQAAVRVDAVRKKDQVTENPVIRKPTIQLYGHDPDARVPSSSCLLGCSFTIVDYESPFNKVDMWKKIIKHYGGEVETKYSSHCTHVICESTKNPIMQQALRETKRCVTAFWLNDVVILKNMVPPWKAVHIPSPCIHDRPCRHHMITISGFEGNERKCLKEMIQIAGGTYTGHMSRLNTLLITRKNEGPKYEKAIEWRIPVVNVQWMNDILFGNYEALKSPSAAKYQNFSLENSFKLDYTNIHHLMFAWRSPIRISELLMAKCVERSPLKTLHACNNKNEQPLEPPSKRIRLSTEENQPMKTIPRVMFSGITNTSDLSNIVLKLGGSIATAANECTHLVVKKMIRTVKVLCCISTCDFIVTISWLHESSRQKKFIDEELFIPDDPEMETVIGCNLKKTLLRKERSLIFQGYKFYVTPTAPPSFKVLCLIIESAGGQVARKFPKIGEIQAINKNTIKFIIISSDADMHLCEKFFTNNISVYNPEVVLTSLMNQHLDLSVFKYKSETNSNGQKQL